MAIGKPSTQTAPAPKPQRVSMSTGSFTSGGLIDDIDVTFTDAQTCEYDYAGTTAPTPSLAIEMTDLNNVAHVQYYSVGKAEDWQAEESGEGFVSVSGKTGINNSTNLGKFLQSMVEAGFPDGALAEGNLKVIIGTKAHVVQQAQERKGLIRTGKNADRPSTTLLVSKIIELPKNLATGTVSGKGAGKTAAAKTASTPAAAGGKPNGAAASASNIEQDEIDVKIIEALQLALAEKGEGGVIPKKDITKLVFQAFTDAPALRSKAVTRAGQLEFLKELGGYGIGFDGAQITSV